MPGSSAIVEVAYTIRRDRDRFEGVVTFPDALYGSLMEEYESAEEVCKSQARLDARKEYADRFGSERELEDALVAIEVDFTLRDSRIDPDSD